MDTTLYTEWLLAHGLGKATIYNYRGKLLQASRIADESGWDLRHLTASQLVSLADRFPDTSSTKRLLRCALIHYWTLHGSDVAAEAITVPDPPPARYRGFGDADADRLEGRATGWWPQGTAVMLGLYLALRRGEMATLHWTRNFNADLTEARIVGKGKKTRFLPVHDALRDELTPLACDGYLFPGHGRAYVHTGTIRSWIGQVAEDVGLAVTNPHALRYTCATRLYEETNDIYMVQRFLGHADSTTTARYLTRVDEEAMRAAVQAISYRRAA